MARHEVRHGGRCHVVANVVVVRLVVAVFVFVTVLVVVAVVRVALDAVVEIDVLDCCC